MLHTKSVYIYIYRERESGSQSKEEGWGDINLAEIIISLNKRAVTFDKKN